MRIEYLLIPPMDFLAHCNAKSIPECFTILGANGWIWSGNDWGYCIFYRSNRIERIK